MSRFLPALIAVAIAALGAYLWGLPKYFGAHPFWADKVLFIGAPIGLILGMSLSRLHYVVGVVVLGLAAVASCAVAYWGKTQFAASYAEDALAGQMWFFGWISICLFIAAVIAHAMIRKN